MNEEVMRNHINLYVNNFSLELGSEGNKAVLELSNMFSELNKKRE
jgi:1,4-dihydroxy-6-naphthoate synthase